MSSSRAQARILLVDDNDRERTELADAIATLGYAPVMAENGEEALEKLGSGKVDAIVTDMMMPRMDGFRLLKALADRSDYTPAVVLTGFGKIREALSAMHDLGAFWFLEKPAKREVLGPLLERAIRQKKLLDETQRLQRQLSHKGVLGDLVGTSEPIRRVFSLIQQVAPTTASVLITGESGTGKERVAAAIHRLSSRATGPFVAINCAALPEGLMESELFGHEKGAFTGAVGRQPGCFEQAHQGTLLLDEIAEMPLASQSRFLRVLENSRVRRLGSTSEVEVDVRVLAATNRPVQEAVGTKLLREDLYYRLNAFQIHIPPLRQRKEDIPPLVEALLLHLNERHSCRIVDLDREAMGLLMEHSWPGNIRELRNVIEWSVITVREGTVSASQLRPGFRGQESPSLLPGLTPRKPPSSELPSLTFEAGRPLHQLEAEYIRYTLKQTGNNKRKTASILGISLRTLYARLAESSATGEKSAEDASAQASAG
ncbi:MAG TPA: sigma-54 dependent transcriptional regulator [Bryobacteraceae bacterium]|jgi:DNA-binding NtrC family response regulator